VNASGDRAAAAEPAHEAALREVALALAHARTSGACAPLIAALAGLRPLLPSPAFRLRAGAGRHRAAPAVIAMFGEESCSFSLHDLFDSLDTWIERARMRLRGTPA
jgi:hypothetical protein